MARSRVCNLFIPGHVYLVASKHQDPALTLHRNGLTMATAISLTLMQALACQRAGGMLR